MHLLFLFPFLLTTFITALPQQNAPSKQGHGPVAQSGRNGAPQNPGDTTLSPSGKYITLPATPPSTASNPIGPSFVSFSIEFASFPDYAGNMSHPNLYSDNLLQNIAHYQGSRPVIRVGGKSQDYAMLDGYIKTALNYTKLAAGSDPTFLDYGGSFFESYKTWPNTKFIHGFNLGKKGEGYRRNLYGAATLACQALSGGKLLYWELGNEPDRYTLEPDSVNGGNVRPKTWNDAAFATEWLNVTRELRKNMGYTCKDMTAPTQYKFIAPSFAGTSGMDPYAAYQAGIDADRIVSEFSTHSYMTESANDASVGLTNTLMNHNAIAKVLAPSFALQKQIAPNLPLALTEVHSLPAPGKQGVTDTFGAALWALDFNLLAASNNVARVHAHQTTNSKAASWQPIRSGNDMPGTLPQYYGHLATAALVGNSGAQKTQVINLPTEDSQITAYGAYVNGNLARVMLINLHPSPITANAARQDREVFLQVPTACQGSANVSRLTATGHDATGSVSFDGLRFDADGMGRGVAVEGQGRESVKVGQMGTVSVKVKDSEAALVSLACK